MKERNIESRRSFIKKSAGAAALLSMPSIVPANVFGANDKVTIAVIGINGRGLATSRVYGIAKCGSDMFVRL